jgi:DNA invertase Pin-like site-specific DNA recombinase
MTLRCALYARYSSDQQRAASIEDQFRICREHAEREGWKIENTYRDAAISGASVILRPGVQGLLEDARRGMFEIVVAEALDRVSRDQADVAILYKHLCFAGVTLVTLAEGEVNELHVGLKGTMNALFLKDLAAKTHRGIRGRVEAGKAGGGRSYGYDVVKALDASGERIRGERAVNEAQAAIVRRIFREFAAGMSPRAIARRLNAEGVPGPTGKLWSDSSIRGDAKRGTGLLNHDLYIGRLVWNRQRFVKNPETGRKVARVNPPEEWIVVEVPELRIVDDGLWQAVKDRQEELTGKYADAIAVVRAANTSPGTNPNRLNGTHRPRYLLSGLLYCGECGGRYALRGADRYVCSRHVRSGSCSNGRSIRRSVIEDRVMSGLRDRLMAPEAAEAAMRAYAEETNRLNRERRASGAGDRKELAQVEKKIATMIAVIEDGGYVRGMMDRLRELEARQDELAERLSTAPADLPDIHPNVAAVYRRRVERLSEALNRPEERIEAANAIRGLIERIVLSPGEKWGEVNATLHGDLATIVEWTGNGGGKGGSGTPGTGLSVSAKTGTCLPVSDDTRSRWF